MGRADLREIDHDQWVPFLAEFSQAHFGEPVEVRVVGRSGDVVAEVPVMPLASIGDHVGDPVDPNAGERIDVVTGTARPASHVVSHPIRVRVASPDGDRPLTVEIDDRDGSTTRVRFLASLQRRPADA